MAENGRKTHPVRVFVARTMTEADLLVGFLQGEGIAARVENALTEQVLYGVEKMLDQEPGIGVVVSSDRQAEAEEAIRAYLEGKPGGDAEGE